jgi:hypothetical protein
VVIVEMSIEQITHGLVRPLANLRDILARQRGQVTGVNYKNYAVTNHNGGISAGTAVIHVLDAVNAFCQPRYLSLIAIWRSAEGRGNQGKS